MSDRVHTNAGLTKNQSLVMDTLTNATGPLGAYNILEQLRDDGFRAPLQVYRALDKLLESGLAHRLESLNAFVACRHDECIHHGQTAFIICDVCSKVVEITDNTMTKRLKLLASNTQFIFEKATIEIRGKCQSCADT